MDILVVSNCPVVESQGSGYVISNTVRSLQQLGHDVHIIPREKMIVFPKVKHTANIYRMALGMGIWVLKNRKAIENSDLIITYGGESYLMLYLIKSVFRIDTPVILHSNGLELHVEQKLKHFQEYLPAVEKKWYHFDTQSLFKYCYDHVDAIITVSEYDRNFAVDNLKVDPAKVFSLEPRLPDLFFNKDEVSIEKQPVIVFCGSWIVRKGVKAIVEGIPEILRNNPEYRFRLIGVGHDFKVEDHFPADVLSQIELFPFVDNKETLIRLYAESDIFLFPSFCESFGLVVAEAMYCGCCVVTGPTGFAASLKNGEEAMVLATPDTAQVVDALKELIASPELRIRMRKAGKARVNGLRWQGYTTQLKQVVEGILAKS